MTRKTRPVFENILARDFSANDINQKWAGKISLIKSQNQASKFKFGRKLNRSALSAHFAQK